MQHGEGREGKRLGVERVGEFVQKGTEEWEMRGWAAARPFLPHNRCVMEVLTHKRTATLAFLCSLLLHQ